MIVLIWSLEHNFDHYDLILNLFHLLKKKNFG